MTAASRLLSRLDADDALALLGDIITLRSRAIDDAAPSDVGRTWMRWEKACDLHTEVGRVVRARKDAERTRAMDNYKDALRGGHRDACLAAYEHAKGMR